MEPNFYLYYGRILYNFVQTLFYKILHIIYFYDNVSRVQYTVPYTPHVPFYVQFKKCNAKN